MAIKKVFFLLVTSFILTLNAASLSQHPILLSGSAYPQIAEEIAKQLNTKLTPVTTDRFNDGEINIRIQESIRGQDVFLIHTFPKTDKGCVNDFLMEMMIMIDGCKRAAVNSVTVVLLYYPYARQDRKASPRVPISACVVAKMLEDVGHVKRVVTVDLHSGQIQGFFHNTPVDNLFASLIFAPYMVNKLKLKDNIVVVSPDAGGVDRARKFQQRMEDLGVKTDFAMIIKERKKAGEVANVSLVGEVKGKIAIIIDDMCDTGGTLVKAADELKQFGAGKIYACITHPIFSKDALQKIAASSFERVIVTNTLPLKDPNSPKITQLCVAPMIAEVITRLHNNQSVSEIFYKPEVPSKS